MVMESHSMVWSYLSLAHLHCMEGLALQQGTAEVPPFYPTALQIPPKAN